jgi:2-dehydropantoate 2-reductase
MKLWLVGVGAVGSATIARVETEPPCRLVDAWAEHVDAIRANGLHIELPDETLTLRLPAYHESELDRIGERPDVVLLAVKSNVTAATVDRLLPYLDDDSAIVSLQNGINEETIASIAGAHRTIGAMVAYGGTLAGPGHAKPHGARGHLTVGELDGARSERVEALAALLRASVDVDVTDDIFGALWTKLIVNAQMNAVCALSGLPTDRMVRDDALRALSIAVAREAVAVAGALGIALDDGMFDVDGDRLRERWQDAAVKPSMLQDAEKGRPIEIDFLNGYVAAKAREVGLEAPANEALVRLAAERGALVGRDAVAALA